MPQPSHMHGAKFMQQLDILERIAIEVHEFRAMHNIMWF
jgi:hypothetical protein